MKNILFILSLLLTLGLVGCKGNEASTPAKKEQNLNNKNLANVKPTQKAKKPGAKNAKKANTPNKAVKKSYWDLNQKEIGYNDQQKAQLKKIETKYAAMKPWTIKDKARKKDVIAKRKAEYNAILTAPMKKKRAAIDRRDAQQRRAKAKKAK